MKKLLFVFAAAATVAASAATLEELRVRCEKKVSSLTLDEKCRLLMNDAAAGERVGVTVKNVSKRDGTAVVQLYAATENAGKGAPLKSLVAFRRVPVKAGATVEASFDVPAKLLVEYAEDGTAKPATQISYSLGL